MGDLFMWNVVETLQTHGSMIVFLVRMTVWNRIDWTPHYKRAGSPDFTRRQRQLRAKMAAKPPASEKQPMFVEPHADDLGPCQSEQNVTNQDESQPITSRATIGEDAETQQAKQNQSNEESHHVGLVAGGAAVVKQTECLVKGCGGRYLTVSQPSTR